ncbi:MAG: TonB-dependent receptor domain-containing protein [Salinibacter sp.]
MTHRSFWHCVAVLCLIAAFLPLHAAAQSRIRGRVINEKTQAPIRRANVLLRREGSPTGTSTDADGRFRLSVAPGEHVLEISALGYRKVRRTVDVSAGETARLTVALAPREYSLNEIVVSGQQVGDREAVSTVQRVGAAAIETQDAADVSELAELVPATHVQTNSRGQTILYFRNAADRQVAQFFDGALLNIPWDNRVNISLIPASVVEEITVTKGVPSVRYGANVMGGAVNFQSRTLDARGRRTELRGALGTAAQRRASVTHLGRTRRWDYTAALQYTSRGNLPLPEGANLEYNQPLDDRRVNTDRTLLSGFGRASYRLENGGQLGLSLLHVDAEQGVAPEGNKNPANGDVRFWRYPLWQKTTAIVSGQVPLGTNTSVRGAAWGSRFARDIADYESIDYRTLNQTQEGRDLTAGLRLIGTQKLPLGTLTLAVNGLTSRHEKRIVPGGQASPSSVSTFRQHIFSTGVEYQAPIHSRVQVTTGISFDGTATPETGPFPERDPIYTWGLNTGVRVDAGGGWTVRGALGRKTRFPTMRELFSGALGKFTPNPNLRPVSAWIGEVGLEHRAPNWSLGITPFYTRVKNTIGKTNVQTPEGQKVKRINLDGARIYGIESTLAWQPTDALRLDGSLTWSRPRTFNEGEIQKLDEKPGWIGTGIVTYELPGGLSLMGQARYTGNVYARLDRVTGRAFGTLPSALILDARLAYDLSGMMSAFDGELYVRGENLTDEVKFIGLGLPRPGRSFRVGVELSF